MSAEFMASHRVQCHRFADGGFVLHKITDPKLTGRLSAWFDASGQLIDCEALDRLHRARPVTKDGFAWSIAARAGRIHFTKLNTTPKTQS
jgi:hypothetical protein